MCHMWVKFYIRWRVYIEKHKWDDQYTWCLKVSGEDVVPISWVQNNFAHATKWKHSKLSPKLKI